MKLDKERRKIIPLVITSVLLLLTLFALTIFNLSPKFLSIALITWILSVGYTLSQTIFRDFTLKDLIGHADDISEEAFKDGETTKGIFSGLVIPLSFVGVYMIVMMLILSFTK